MIGATYNLLPGLTLYGGYSEANRAPTAAELACADPEFPCLIESFLTADPPLKQVVSHTFELGLRGKLASFGGDQKLEWTAGLFRTENTDDILCRRFSAQGRGYFQNAGDTLRQGVELGVIYQEPLARPTPTTRSSMRRFRTANVLSSPDNLNGGSFDCDDHVATGDRRPVVTRDDDALCIHGQFRRPPARRAPPPLQGWIRLLGDGRLEGRRRRRGRQRPSSTSVTRAIPRSRLGGYAQGRHLARPTT